MSVHDSRNWAAKEGTNFAGGDRKVTVTGEVQVGGGNEEPVLTRADPQGTVPDILLLDLGTCTTDDAGTDVLVWKPAHYEEPVERHQFKQVQIRDHATVDVEEIIS